jgi:hypothetical protein
MSLWFITFKLGEIGSFGEWTWFEILLPFWLNLGLMFFVELAKRLAEENEIK